MRRLVKTSVFAGAFAGGIAAFIAIITLSLNWNLFDFFGGPLPGYRVLLFPGNLSLVYIWHPLFTEEVDLIPKMVLIVIGQFALVAVTTGLVVICVKSIKRAYHHLRHELEARFNMKL